MPHEMQMEPAIGTRPAFRVLALSRKFRSADCMAEIPKFWSWFYENNHQRTICGRFGICYGAAADGTEFRYAIASPYQEGEPVPEGFEVLTVPAREWAVFPCVGPMPDAIQQMWKFIYSEWLPNSGREKLNDFDIEEYTPGELQSSGYRSYIWIPLKSDRVFEARADYSVRTGELTVPDYIRLFQSAGWEAPPEDQVAVALRNSVAVFSIYAGDTLVGMGRLLGDRSTACFMRDVVILPEYRRHGAGTFLLKAMLDSIRAALPAGWKASCELFAARGKTSFYRNLGFQELPNRFLANGMMRMVESSRS